MLVIFTDTLTLHMYMQCNLISEMVRYDSRGHVSFYMCMYMCMLVQMLDDKGNTAVYLLYAFTRIRCVCSN